MTPTLTYMYCLVRTRRRPVLRRVPAGMPGGGPVRVLPAGQKGWWLVVSSVPDRDYGEAALQRGLQSFDWVGRRAMVHEAIVERFLSAPAVLPMQLFTLFTSDERAAAHVARDRRRIARILSRVEGHVEWGLRLTWDEREARKAAGRARRAGRAGKAGGGGPGAVYLARKRDLLDVDRAQLAAARKAANRFYRVLAREAGDSRRHSATEQAAPGSRLLLDAAFLVPRRRATAFRATVRRHARTLSASGVIVSPTGPWPPYNFI